MSKLLKSKFFLGSLVAVAFALAGTTTAMAYTHTMTLKMGSNNSQVMSLQQTLNTTATCKVGAVGTAGGPGTETMYFGAKTKAAVQCFQASKGLTADGIVGPMTGAALSGVVSTGVFPAGCTSNAGYSPLTGMSCAGGVTTLPAGCTTTAGYSPTTGMSCSGGSTPSQSGPLVGGAGSLDDVQNIASLSDEQIAEGDTGAKIAGFTISADDGSDLAITALKLSFDMTSGSGSDKLTKYADTVTVWQGSTKVGSAKVSDFSENSNVYSKTINLSGAVVRANQDSDFYVSVDALSNIDSTDLGNNTWTLTLESVRFEDATGAILTDSSTGDLGTAAADVDFSFETVATAAGTELRVSTTSGSSGDAVNKGHVVEVDDTTNTDDVALLAFDLKSTGKVQNIQDIPVGILASGAQVNEIASSFSLWKDGVQIDTVNVSDGTTDNYTSGSEVAACAGAACGIHFDDVDFDMTDGQTSHFVVKANVNDEQGAFGDGDNLTASINATALADFDAEDSNGDSLTSELKGSATADAVAFYVNGINVKLNSASANSVTVDGANNDRAELTIKFDVTAFGNDAYVVNAKTQTSVGTTSVGTAPNTTQGVGYHIQYAGTSPLTTETGATTLTSTADEQTNSFLVKEGTTETFTLKVVVTNDGTPDLSGDSVRAILTGVGFGDSDSATADSVYTFNLDQFKTDYAIIAD